MKKPKRVHFVGIGGAGMSGLAKVLFQMGVEVTGSDLKESKNTLRLSQRGIEVRIGHSASNVEGAQLVVVSSAIPKENCELRYAKEKGIPIYPRAKMLAELARDRKMIAVAGTHGKTTTTSMVSLMLKKSGLDPTFLIGGELNDIGSNAQYGRGDYLVAETDESDGSLLHLDPEIIVITNMEPDHLDFFESFAEIEKLFLKFIEKLPNYGRAIVCGDHSNLRSLGRQSQKNFITYGFASENDYFAKEVIFKNSGSRFEVWKGNRKLGKVFLGVPGEHNIHNALATIALGLFLEMEFPQIASILKTFSGVERRFQSLGAVGRIRFIDDYAHHPTEVKVTLKATVAATNGKSRIVSIFQPHRFSRTLFLRKEFGEAFSEADVVILTDVYAAGESPIPGVSGKLIVDEILKHDPQKNLIYLPKLSEVRSFLEQFLESGDVVLTMGAGDIGSVGETVFRKLKENS